ncbi:hypothetical protein LCGC14_2935470 [marine sediment metagenome]|uniref:Uncharacterized protein n=1 Tax=marine sediment metagenome TaxID=412755 RepID=A0A0F9AAN8_9ZZZZ|nr:hypothetical protein [Phycisphaerales bacterium]
MRCISLLLVIVALSGLTGCQGPAANLKPVEVFIDGDGEFPAFLVGTWKAYKLPWEIVFEEDGTISSAVINMGRQRIIPGQIKTIPLREGGEGVYEPGQWLVRYVPDTRELMVDIVIDHMRMEKSGQIIEGKAADTFIGTISEDGRSWTADWDTFYDYTAYTPEPTKLTSGPDRDSVVRIIFLKDK